MQHCAQYCTQWIFSGVDTRCNITRKIWPTDFATRAQNCVQRRWLTDFSLPRYDNKHKVALGSGYTVRLLVAKLKLNSLLTLQHCLQYCAPTILEVDTRCNWRVACNIARNAAPCVSAFILSGVSCCAVDSQWSELLCCRFSVEWVVVLSILSGVSCCAVDSQRSELLCCRFSVEWVVVLSILSGVSCHCAVDSQWSELLCCRFSAEWVVVLSILSGVSCCAVDSQWSELLCCRFSAEWVVVLSILSGVSCCAVDSQRSELLCCRFSAEWVVVLSTPWLAGWSSSWPSVALDWRYSRKTWTPRGRGTGTRTRNSWGCSPNHRSVQAGRHSKAHTWWQLRSQALSSPALRKMKEPGNELDLVQLLKPHYAIFRAIRVGDVW